MTLLIMGQITLLVMGNKGILETDNWLCLSVCT